MSDWQADAKLPGFETRLVDGKREYQRTADCVQRGHCWHEADGSVWRQHAGREAGEVSVLCCWCGHSTALRTKGNSVAPSARVGASVVPHGSYTKPE